MIHYDFLIVGAGLFGSTIARLLTDMGKRVLVIEKRNEVGGNIYTYEKENIVIHKYGAHIFHTDNELAWKFVNKYAKMLPFINMPVANYHGKLYNLPFNMYTFEQLWGVKTAEDAKKIIAKQSENLHIDEPKNLEEHILKIAGSDVYLTLVKDYTEKQWGKSCKELPASIIKRLPLRFEYNNNYFNDKYQAIPEGGYSALINNLLKGIDVLLNTNYLSDKVKWSNIASKVIYTGPIDAYFNYCLGHLEYRSLEFKTEKIEKNSFQGIPVMNFTSHDEPYTRIIEHKFFAPVKNKEITYITKEYPKSFNATKEPYYPINDQRNNDLYLKYNALAAKEENVYFGGRLGLYKYLDMDDAIIEAFKLFANISHMEGVL